MEIVCEECRIAKLSIMPPVTQSVIEAHGFHVIARKLNNDFFCLCDDCGVRLIGVSSFRHILEEKKEPTHKEIVNDGCFLFH